MQPQNKDFALSHCPQECFCLISVPQLSSHELLVPSKAGAANWEPLHSAGRATGEAVRLIHHTRWELWTLSLVKSAMGVRNLFLRHNLTQKYGSGFCKYYQCHIPAQLLVMHYHFCCSGQDPAKREWIMKRFCLGLFEIPCPFSCWTEDLCCLSSSKL